MARGSRGSGSKKAKRSGSNIFALFTPKQIQEFKEAFSIMDTDKDGVITSSDLMSAFSAVGRPISESDARTMLAEAPGPINFTQLVTLFAEKMTGGTDDDDVILKSFEAFEVNGKIDAEMFRHSMVTYGDKFTQAEVDQAFSEFKIEAGQIDAAHLKAMMTAKKEED